MAGGMSRTRRPNRHFWRFGLRGSNKIRCGLRLAPEEERDPRGDSGEREQAPPDALAELRGHGARARVRDPPADAEDDAADEVLAPRLDRLPLDRLVGQKRAQSQRPDEPKPPEGGDQPRDEHGVEGTLLEQQALADHVRAGQPRQGEGDAEDDADEPTRQTRARHQITALMRKLTPMAVAKNVAVARML